RGATLRVVRAWSRWSAAVTGTAEPYAWPVGPGRELDEEQERAARQLVEWVEAAKRRTGARDVATEVETQHGDAAPVLLAASEDADLLVVGGRGRHDPARLFLRSISRDLAREARCPLVLVPDRGNGDEPRVVTHAVEAEPESPGEA